MKRFLAVSVLLLLAVGSTALAQDCRNGQCQLVQVPKAVVSQSAEVAKEVVAAPVQVMKQVKVKKPVRHFLRKVFAR
tara:strand:+ start:218 stop:448 length:231 start_codon:yes stop_codon:yes gene_type:complete